GDIRIELPLQQGDLILEEKLASLEPADLQLVVAGVFQQACDHTVQVAMLDLQLLDALEDRPAFTLVVLLRHRRFLLAGHAGSSRLHTVPRAQPASRESTVRPSTISN